MLSRKPIIFSVFFLLFLVGTITVFRKKIVLLIYSVQPCAITFEVDRKYEKYGLHIADTKKLKSFVKQITNCENGNLTIYPSSTKQKITVENMTVRLQDHPLLSTQNNKNGVVFGYYSYVSDKKGILIIAPTENIEGYRDLDNYFALTITRRLDTIFNQENLVIRNASEYDSLSEIGLSL